MLITIDSKMLFTIDSKKYCSITSEMALILSKEENLGGCGIVKPGKYMIGIKPIWNNGTAKHPDLKKILLDIYCPE